MVGDNLPFRALVKELRESTVPAGCMPLLASPPGLLSLPLLPGFSEDYFPLGSTSKATELFTQSAILLQTWDKMRLSFPISGHNDV